jgi:capsular polysaccharide biosynthesis protein
MENALMNDELVLKREEHEEFPHNEEISLAELLRVIISGKWLIMLFVVVGLIASFVYIKYLSDDTGRISTIISYNYNGIEEGLDPNGKNMDVSMIKSPVVLEQVVKALSLDQLGISSDDLRLSLNITPIIPGNVTENIKRLEEQKTGNIEPLQKYVYYPNRYLITFKMKRKLNVSAVTAQQIVDEVVKQYQQYFYRTYSDMSVLANAIQPVDYSEYDYPEVSKVIHNQLNIFTNFLRTKLSQSDGRNFRSIATGLSFQDILESVSIIKEVDLNRLDSLIGAYNLTKNKEKLIRLYEYRIKTEELNMAQKNDEAALLTDMIQKYQKDKKLVLAAAASMEGAQLLDIEETDEYYNTLTDKYVSAGIAAKTSANMIIYYQKEIEKLLNDTVDEVVKARAEQDVNEYIPVIKERIEHWIDLTNQTVDEYYQINLFNKAITRLSPSQYTSNLGDNKMVIAIAAALALMLGVCIVFIRYYLKKN